MTCGPTPESASEPVPASLARRLGTGDAVVIGLGSMIGAGIFAAFSPAAEVAGAGLLIGLAIAAGSPTPMRRPLSLSSIVAGLAMLAVGVVHRLMRGRQRIRRTPDAALDVD